MILSQDGAAFPFDPDTVYGTVDRTFTDSTTQGGTLQATGKTPLFGLGNIVTAGGSLDDSTIGFRSNSTLGRIFPSLRVGTDPTLAGSGNIVHTLGNLGYAPADLGATTHYYGLYAVDALDLTAALTLTAGFRLNAAEIDTRDRSGNATELDGRHDYSHLNPMAGATYKIADSISLFGNYAQANRAPTPLELDCASRTQPCLLEGSLVADPPLRQVVTQTGELGARGAMAGPGGTLSWSASLFPSDSDNDIVALASVIAGRGYFTNVPLTRRQGVDLSGRFKAQGWSSYVSYSYLDATEQFSATLASPNNPGADGDGNVAVTPGRHIPLNPMHQMRAGGDVDVLDNVSLGGEFAFTGSQYYDGDPSNLNARLPAYWVVNLRASWRLAPGWQLFGLVNNLFDRHDATYATYFGTDDTAALFAVPLSDPRSVTLRPPISAQLGVKLDL